MSADQGLTLSQQSGCVMYTETSSKVNPPSVFSTFEVAALAKVSHMSRIPRYIEFFSEKEKYFSWKKRNSFFLFCFFLGMTCQFL